MIEANHFTSTYHLYLEVGHPALNRTISESGTKGSNAGQWDIRSSRIRYCPA